MPQANLTITLIGYRGSGKTTVAPVLASRLKCDWVDADVEIEQRSGRTIQQIFADGGEAEFRQIERQLMQDLLIRGSLIIAAGGGAILDQDTRADMRSAGPVVLLNASVEELARRISTDATTGQRRPSLTGQPVEQEVAAVLKVRQPLYDQAASIVIQTEGRSTDEIVDQICDQLSGRNDVNQDESNTTTQNSAGSNSIQSAGDQSC